MLAGEKIIGHIAYSLLMVAMVYFIVWNEDLLSFSSSVAGVTLAEGVLYFYVDYKYLREVAKQLRQS